MSSAELYPLTFRPILKQRVWGGRRLEQLYGKELPPGVPVGESWEISDRLENVSVIAAGPLAGRDLHWLVRERRSELMGHAGLEGDRFPLLIKILDCSEKLSLQVHPPAHKARMLGGEPKTEMWYVADAAPDAELFVGLKRGCTREEFNAKINSGSVAECFHRLKVRTGDTMFLPSGRVHALGAGLVIFEIQQNSDTTYRVFDWNRLGLDGKPRQLHLAESLASIDFADFEPGLVRPVHDKNGLASLVNDPLFKVSCASLATGRRLPLLEKAMQIIGIVSGEVEIVSVGMRQQLRAGQFCLIPASCEHAVVTATADCKALLVWAGSPVAL
jgi:mannose-6-phosphate isomerase